MTFSQFYYLQENNTNYSDYQYYGIKKNQEEEIQQLKQQYHQTTDKNIKQQILNKFEDYYQQIVGYNPILNKIDIIQPDYKGLNTPLMDLVHGVSSGIPPENIKDYIEVTKGIGGLNIPDGYRLDKSNKNNYIKLIQNETNQSGAIQGNTFGDFPMTTFQSSSTTLPIPGSNTANKIKRKKQYVKPGNKKIVPKYNVGRVNMNTLNLPYQTNSSSL